MQLNDDQFIYSDEDETYYPIVYYLFVVTRSDSIEHYIAKYDQTDPVKTMRWACSRKGDSDTNWANRLTLTYFKPAEAWEKENLIEEI